MGCDHIKKLQRLALPHLFKGKMMECPLCFSKNLRKTHYLTGDEDWICNDCEFIFDGSPRYHSIRLKPKEAEKEKL